MRAEGKGNKVEEDYLGVVVLGLFNAAIGFSDIQNELVFCEAVVSPLLHMWLFLSNCI